MTGLEPVAGDRQMKQKRPRKKRKIKRPLAVIGWREWVGLPELGIERIKVKADTGARSSALHAFDIERFDRAGQPWVRFKVHPEQRSSRAEVAAEAPLHDQRWVRSSSGRATFRPVIRTRIGLAGVVWPIEITLVRRDMMGFRMLLGRQALRRRFLVDAGRSFLADKRGEVTAEPGAERR